MMEPSETPGTGPRVALLMNLGRASTSEVARAVRDAPASRGWQLRLTQTHDLNMDAMASSKPAGIIARIGDAEFEQQLAGLETKTLNISSYARDLAGPRCTWDDEAIGRMAAEHLLDRNFTHFASTGGSLCFAPEHRAQTFRETVEDRGGQFVSLAFSRDNEAATAEQLRRLPKPLAVFAAARDEDGVAICDICQRAGLAVPDQVAVLGVGNTPLICDLSHPPLSSVQLPAAEVGRRAAELMDRWLRFDELPPQETRIAPRRIVTRTSTDVIASADPIVRQALQIIRKNACEPLRVRDLAAGLPLSRRPFEKRFKAAVGLTPLQEINRVRVRRASNLLADTDRSVTDIALDCGFASATRLGETFHRLTGQTPTDYRREQRTS